MTTPTLFISDLHLSATRADKLRLFEQLLLAARGRVAALYILGDLFDVWVGDDDTTPPAVQVTAALRDFSAHTPLYLMRGNRDFLLGEKFSAATGALLLDDPSIIHLHTRRVLVLHGDLLCTQDVGYQRVRTKVRSPQWQAFALSKPLWLRKLYGRYARIHSRLAAAGKAAEIMDVHLPAVQSMFAEHQVTLMIHGHTHRPAIHEQLLNAQPHKRIVLGDWYEQDSVLWCEAGVQTLLRVEKCLQRLSSR